jgi:hypothetical protein
VPRLLFDYDETPLLLVDGSELDFVDDQGDLEDLLREIDRTVSPARTPTSRAELAAQELFRMNDRARMQIIPRKP